MTNQRDKKKPVPSMIGNAIQIENSMSAVVYNTLITAKKSQTRWPNFQECEMDVSAELTWPKPDQTDFRDLCTVNTALHHSGSNAHKLQKMEVKKAL